MFYLFRKDFLCVLWLVNGFRTSFLQSIFTGKYHCRNLPYFSARKGQFPPPIRSGPGQDEMEWSFESRFSGSRQNGTIKARTLFRISNLLNWPSPVRWERVPQSAKIGTPFSANTNGNCHFSEHLLIRSLFSVSSLKCHKNRTFQHPSSLYYKMFRNFSR